MLAREPWRDDWNSDEAGLCDIENMAKKLNRSSSHRKALRMNLATQLFTFTGASGRLSTKPSTSRGMPSGLITIAKRGLARAEERKDDRTDRGARAPASGAALEQRSRFWSARYSMNWRRCTPSGRAAIPVSSSWARARATTPKWLLSNSLIIRRTTERLNANEEVRRHPGLRRH